MKQLVFHISFLFSFCSMFAQNDCPCCSANHKAFDFWEGDWIVYDTLGNVVGENTLVRLEDNCILSEHWRGAKGGTGRSYNYFSKADSTWNQIWIDNTGNNLVLKGKSSVDGQMILRSELLPGQKIDYYHNQITWTKNLDSTVTQLWEIFDKEGKLINTAFKGIYKKRTE